MSKRHSTLEPDWPEASGPKIPQCPCCGMALELRDILAEAPPIPTHAWPTRWQIDDGEGGQLAFCPRCEWDLDPVEIATNAGLEPLYPWEKA